MMVLEGPMEAMTMSTGEKVGVQLIEGKASFGSRSWLLKEKNLVSIRKIWK